MYLFIRPASANRALRALLVSALSIAIASQGAIAAPPKPPPTPARGRIDELQKAAELQFRTARQPEMVPPFRSQGPVPMPPNNGESVPSPVPEPAFTPDQFRLPLLDAPTAGTTPRPTVEVKQQFDKYIERTVDPENTLDLIRERPRLLLFKQAPIRVQIADEKVATYTLITDTELSVVGNEVGSTVLNLWFPNPQDPNQPKILSYLVRVIPDPEQKERLDRLYLALEHEINRTFKNSVVHLNLVGDKLVVSGEAKDIVESTQILRVVSANAPGAGRGNQDDGASEIPVGQLNVTAVPDAFGNLPVQGLQNFMLNDIGRNVINLMRVPGEHQVMLRVTVAEINRSAARSIGMDFSLLNRAGLNFFKSTTAGLIPTAVLGSGVAGGSGAAGGSSTGSVGASGNLPALIDNGQVSLAIQALRNINFARSLAEPNVVTLNGQAAFFRAGGEFPVPAGAVSFGAAAQGVGFVPFGVSLMFIPYITDRDRVRLMVMASVSTRDPSLGTNVGTSGGSTSVSGLTSRVFRSTVELREGQTLAVAGLNQTNYGATSVRVPFFGDLPIIGSLFGKNNNTQAEQELVILVTPELVHPLQACEGPPLPGADVFEPGDVEFYLLNRLEGRRSVDFRSSVRTDWNRLVRYSRCDDIFIIGAHGQTYNCCPNRGACPPGMATPHGVPVASVAEGSRQKAEDRKPEVAAGEIHFTAPGDRESVTAASPVAKRPSPPAPPPSNRTR